jgi:hypothetical protein
MNQRFRLFFIKRENENKENLTTMATFPPAHTPKPLGGVCALWLWLLLVLTLALAPLSGGFGSFLFNQHIHFSLPTVVNTLAQTLAFFMAFGCWLLALGSY